MSKIIYSLDVTLVVTYFALFLLYARNLSFSGKGLRRLLVWALPAAVALHFIKLLLQGMAGSHCPIIGIYETTSFLSFSIALIYLIIERYQRYFGTGAIFMAIILIFQAVSLFAPASVTMVPQNLSKIPFGLHAPIVLVGVAAFTTSAISGVIYLLSFRKLKKKDFSLSQNKIPSLESMEKMVTLSSLLGVILVATGLAAGFVIARVYNEHFNLYDPKIVITIITLLIFLYGLVGSWLCSFSGKKKAVIVLIGFFAALISMTLIRFCSETFHRF